MQAMLAILFLWILTSAAPAYGVRLGDLEADDNITTTAIEEFINATSGSITLSASNVGKTIRNNGATDTVTALLPTCESDIAGYSWLFKTASDAEYLLIDPESNQSIWIAGESDPLAIGVAVQGPLMVGGLARATCVIVGETYVWELQDDGTWTEEVSE